MIATSGSFFIFSTDVQAHNGFIVACTIFVFYCFPRVSHNFPDAIEVLS